jgi:hypothetical protein
MNPFLIPTPTKTKTKDHADTAEECEICGRCFSCDSWLDCAANGCEDELEHVYIEDGRLAFQRNDGERVLSFCGEVGHA